MTSLGNSAPAVESRTAAPARRPSFPPLPAIGGARSLIGHTQNKPEPAVSTSSVIRIAIPGFAALALAACAGTGGAPGTRGAGAAPGADPQYVDACLTQAVPVIQRQAAYFGFLRSAAEEYLLVRAQYPSDRLMCSFQQVNGGVPVQHYEYEVHLSARGEVLHSAGRYAPGAAGLSPVPGVSEIDILERAMGDAAAGLGVEEPFVAPPRLLFVPVTAADFRLIFEVIASKPGSPQALRLTYDARNGQKIGQSAFKTGG